MVILKQTADQFDGAESAGTDQSALIATGSDVLELIGDAVISTDEGGSILLFNHAAEKTFGFEAEEVLGRSVELLLPARFRDEHADHVRDFAAGEDGAQRIMGHRREAVGRRKGGEEFPVEAVVSRRTVGDRNILTVVVRDITERKALQDAMDQQNAALRASETHLRLALKGGRMGTWEWNLKTGELQADASARALFGVAGHVPSTMENAFERIHDGDVPDVQTALAEAVEKRHDFRCEFRVISADGSWRWIAGKGAVLSDRHGDPDKLAGVVFDVTDRRELDEQRRLISSELSHRFKNMIAVLNSVVSLSGRNADSVEDYRASLSSRLRSVARTQNMLLSDSGSGMTLIEQLAGTFEPYRNSEGTNVLLEGPAVSLDPHAAVPLGMVLHELATNAAKYGSLSTNSGRVEVRWCFVPDDHGRCLRLNWNEIGGPAVSPPKRKGFGSTLIEKSIKQSLRGDIVLRPDPDGFRCEIMIPVDAPDITEPDAA